jgi:hypothetical protein
MPPAPKPTPKKKSKRKAQPRKLVVKKLTAAFNLYIRLRDAEHYEIQPTTRGNPSGYDIISGSARCISCGQIKPLADIDAGHYVGSKCQLLRWDERNVNAECKGCNGFDEFHVIWYARRLDRKHKYFSEHPSMADYLRSRRHEIKKWTMPELREKLKYYQNKLREM